MIRCSICHTRVQESDGSKECESCHQTYHQTCWDGIGGCATYGCGEAAEASKPAPQVAHHRGWGDQKNCPSCDAVLTSSALNCQCGAEFPWADPMTKTDYQEWLDEERSRMSIRRYILLLFFLTLIALPAPITGPIAGIWAFRKRDLLSGIGGGGYRTLAYGTAVLSLVYTIMFIALLMGA